MCLPWGVQLWIKDEVALYSLQCFDTDGWVTGRTSGRWSHFLLIPRGSVHGWMGGGGGLEWYRLTQVYLEKWPLNGSSSYEVCPKQWLNVMWQFWLMMFGCQFRLHAACTLHTLELMWANMVLGCIVVVSISFRAVTWFGGRTDTACKKTFSVDHPVWFPWL